jgi:hypothetical protein
LGERIDAIEKSASAEANKRGEANDSN